MWDDDFGDIPYGQSLISKIQELGSSKEKEETSPSSQMSRHTIRLILEKDDLTTIVTSWQYPFAPEIYYHRGGVLRIDEYHLYASKGAIGYYKYKGSRKDEQPESL